jgi:UDP-N-acetylglucosamine 2-epimerase (non-hydrolysing)
MSSYEPLAIAPPGALPRLALVVGTRPEAIKVAPVALAARASGRIEPTVIVTGQHADLAHQALERFGVAVDRRLEPLPDGPRGQDRLLAHLLPGLTDALVASAPSAVLVQGDTASAFAGALAGHLLRLPVAHLEAGLRSFDKANPFPEETYRRAIAPIADLHLAPTEGAAANLAAEGIDRGVHCIGNTVIDAVQAIASGTRLAAPAGAHRRVLVTVHRRENWGAPLRGILAAVKEVVRRVPDIEVVLPVHPNPAVRLPIVEALGGIPRIVLLDPLDHAPFVQALAGSTLVLSDSGGVQEEAPALGVPVLVLRETTERPEAVAAGCARLVGTDPERIVATAVDLLTDEAKRRSMAQVANPFGDGAAAPRAIEAILSHLGLGSAPAPWVAPPVARPMAAAG